MRRLLSTIRRPREASRRVGLRAGGAALAVSCLASLAITTSAAQAVVVDDAGTQAGVALTPDSRYTASLPSGVNYATSGSACADPWLSADLGGPAIPTAGLCYRGGPVIHKNETYALTWDAPYQAGDGVRHYWQETLGYMEQFLRDVANASGSLNSPYALTTQYNDGSGAALNASVFGGGCIDHGGAGKSACEYGDPTQTGHDFPSGGCAVKGASFTGGLVANSLCLTDAQIQQEVSTMAGETGIVSGTARGYTPLVTLLLPPGVETCLDAAHNLCSVNGQLNPPPPTVTAGSLQAATIGAATYKVKVTYQTASGESVSSTAVPVTTTSATSTITISSPISAPGATGWTAYVTGPNGNYFMQQGSASIGSDITLDSLSNNSITPPSNVAFCSYHSQVNVGGTEVSYVVQPWTFLTGCDDPDAPALPDYPTVQQLSVAAGQRMAGPFSQSEIAALVNPGLNGWAAQNGWEIDDNGCTPEAHGLDTTTIGSNTYYLQREYDNGFVLDPDPYTYGGCAPLVDLQANFVPPSQVNPGDLVEFDGASSLSTLIIPNGNYAWNFGDGTSAVGASVVHSFSKAGTYTVTLKVTDRGGNKSSVSQTVTIGTAGQTPTTTPVTPPTTQPSTPAPGPAFRVRMQLTPKSLGSVLRNGLALRVNSNKVANGILTVSITRAEAKRAHIKVGRGNTVVIARGTTAGIKNGTSFLRLHLPKGIANKLKKLRHATFSVRLALVAAGGGHLAIDAAGRY